MAMDIAGNKLLVFLTAGMAFQSSAFADDGRPNFVWFMAEDVSKHYLDLYTDGDTGARTPNVDRLAEGGIVFSSAYSNAPVSSAARSSLITGCYAPRLGVSFHRKLRAVPMPEGQHMFPAYLRAAGYHTSNAAKTDYNCMLDKEAWDVVAGTMGEWRNRKDKDQPFFFVRTNDMTHEAKQHFPESDIDSVATRYSPEDVQVHPYHPDTRLMRYTYARFFDRIEDSDRELGKLVSMLEEDGLLDNTFIFYFGDNGGTLPGTKGYTTETGLNVPLVVYIPEKWRDRIPMKAGTRCEGAVSFIDLGPTLLHLAGIDVPEGMDGRPVLGEDITEESLKGRSVYCYGDRFDELYAFNRTLRKGNFKYSRNFQPYHPKSLFAFYRYRQAAFREWEQMFEDGRLNSFQSAFFRPQGAEELYDLSKDPYELVNLASDPEYSDILKEMRADLKEHMLQMNDLGFYPECEWLNGASDPVSFGVSHSEDICTYSEIADLQLLPFRKAKKRLVEALKSDDPVGRYWAATVCASFGRECSALDKELRKLLSDTCPYVRSRAVVALCTYDGADPADIMKNALHEAGSGAESLLIMNDMAYLKSCGYEFGLVRKDVVKKCAGWDWRLEYLK